MQGSYPSGQPGSAARATDEHHLGSCAAPLENGQAGQVGLQVTADIRMVPADESPAGGAPSAFSDQPLRRRLAGHGRAGAT